MPCVNFRSVTGRQVRVVEAQGGESVMRAAVRSGVPGIVGECGGELNCGTCHAYVDDAWVDRVPPKRVEESELLEVLDDSMPGSRLTCQIPITDDVDGLTLTVPSWEEPASAPAPDSASGHVLDQCRFDVVIVGAGHGGTQLATALAQRSPELRVALVSSEDSIPYDRPSLSKAYLLGEASLEEIRLRPAAYWDAAGVELVLGDAVVEVDATQRLVRTASGRALGYNSLVWAAGGRARPLPDEVAQAPYLTLRGLADAEQLQQMLASAKHVTLIGGGYIGLEAAAVLRSRTIDVTLIEAQERLLARVTGSAVSDFFAAEHRRAGVDVRLGRTVMRVSRSANHEQTDVLLDDGSSLTTDLVVAGIGMVPNVEALERAGAEVGNGVVVDEYCKTSLPNVYAIGDCAAHHNRFARGRIRLECVQNAVDQAKVVEGVILGERKPFEAVPWFWSNQFEIRLKSAGIVGDADSTVVRRYPETGAFSVAYFRGEDLVAVDAINAPGDYAKLRQAIRDGSRVDQVVLADTSTDIAAAIRVHIPATT
ncbi:hypothetical protein Aple_075390 [Acrocarpospora pleiomorpha]|uniref:2Fe-2S ferredoxin-type domain-containing protein n=1 Tax=Acrocarpospora pleiomorpha TaxID=90975 RepID=A0A5M3XUR7_9ACTN|nr:FAD-dependent oxidoreductase [Acrocarpospora pleiomorpha]GES24640.1 hypothetical protein Aple_075390 [Acrocarpospora pleiomorpha]